MRRVAICLVGEARVIHCDDVSQNIFKTMVEPIRQEADVFVAVKPSSSYYGPPPCIPPDVDAKLALRRHLTATFDPLGMVLRSDDRKADKLGIRTAGVPCLRMIEEHEENIGASYSFVMHLRTDIVYTWKLPPFGEWPVYRPDQREIFVEDCARGPGPGGVCTLRHTEEQYLGCARDTWAVMSRATAPIYYEDSWNFTRINETAFKRLHVPCVPHHIYQCGLGCNLHAENVTIHATMMRGKICHNQPPSPRDVDVADQMSFNWTPCAMMSAEWPGRDGGMDAYGEDEEEEAEEEAEQYADFHSLPEPPA